MKFARLALAALAIATAAPVAIAATADIQRLHQYAGSWQGRGELTGEEDGTVNCRLTMNPRGEQLTFNGRCTLTGGLGSQSFQGAIAYNDAAGRYEAISRGTDPVVGRRNGSGIVFNFAGNNTRGAIETTMSLRGGNQIVVQFKMTNRRTGETTEGQIPFAKA